MLKIVALVAFAALAFLVPAAAGQAGYTWSEYSMGIDDGNRLGVGNIATVTVAAAAAPVVSAHVEIGLYATLAPTGIAGASFTFLVDTPGGVACSGEFDRTAGAGREAIVFERSCESFPAVNGTYWLNITAAGNAGLIRGYVRPMVTQNFTTMGDEMEIQTSLDPWVPYLILALLFIGAARANAFGVAFVAALAIGLTAAGNPWPVGAVALFAMAAGLAWWLPEWYRNYRARRATKGGAQ